MNTFEKERMKNKPQINISRHKFLLIELGIKKTGTLAPFVRQAQVPETPLHGKTLVTWEVIF